MPLVAHYWADLESRHGLRCYGNITRTQNVSEYMLVLALCLVLFWFSAVDQADYTSAFERTIHISYRIVELLPIR